ncbi:M28 family peptidase [Bowmanella sp. Y26]|uniref:M28 family metallopeptidase n=1 Tax=Bowmanella yangjiangensis TaxID=2811230 RepID=UPI001BDC83A9|nr:M28 family metallopeptidase [Bowmanella yangjiangensis]MBT1065775.1 M28 family peptidase [Bowmanella yangjiangensis]
MKRSLITLCLLLGSSLPAWAEADLPKADANRLQAHLQFLSHDLLEGRDTGSRGHDIAAQYMLSQFAQLGLKPAGDNGSYLQAIPFRQAYLVQDSAKLVLKGTGGETSLEYPRQYLTSASLISEVSQLQGKLVFAGYGIVAPELQHDDYAKLDVKGKVVVVLSGKPKSFPSEEGAHFGSGSEKSRHAAEHGAIGMLTISTPLAEKVRPYQNLLNYLHMPSVSWLKADGEPANQQPQLKNSAYFSQDAAALLFAGAPRSLEEIYADLEQDKSPAGFALPTEIEFSKRSEHKTISSPNVAAILPGSDAKLKDEYVVYTAHLDHIGFAKTVKQDKINNGAMDNASGSSVLLETARLLSGLPQAPKRSILFLSVTGEEKGLLGADYFANHPTVPLKSMVANVNLDMPILTYEAADVIAFGANHSSLQATVADAVAKLGMSLSPDPWPEQALFTRSDHYMFVKKGVPAVFLVPGLTSMDPNVDGAKKFGEFLHTDYHKPSDELNDNFNWRAAQRFTEANLQIGLTIANDPVRPSWNEGDFFGNTFGQ